MKIILLRHEQRDSDPSFNIHLNNNGMNNRKEILSSLKKHNIDIDVIISSPFLRCLDTVLPICDYFNINICVDYALSEFFDNTFKGDKIPRNFNKNEIETYPFESTYISSLELSDFKENYDWESLQLRLSNLLTYIREKYSDKTILIVTHMTIINALLNLNNIPRVQEEFYPMGRMTLMDNLSIL